MFISTCSFEENSNTSEFLWKCSFRRNGFDEGKVCNRIQVKQGKCNQLQQRPTVKINPPPLAATCTICLPKITNDLKCINIVADIKVSSSSSFAKGNLRTSKILYIAELSRGPSPSNLVPHKCKKLTVSCPSPPGKSCIQPWLQFC